MKFNLKALTKPIQEMENKLSKMTQEKRQETAIKMWYGAAQFKGVTIGLETVWKQINKKTIKAKKQLKEKKMTEKELDKYKKFMLKKVYPNTEKSKPFRKLIQEIDLSYNKQTQKNFDIIIKDIKQSKQKAYQEHMDYWTKPNK